eukprot:CAMPEP_0172611076 /NCGR_PEP_ID=MMETSP1068-20121228/30799_1 /TAXON_ID=35684 /ORGANISM="Pseudopedinella elastica, Strain CCMP716" /LENGTH=428 /DNA_ID=CAMNT_0013414957 /DNA_START=132 /DNA_END=1415 /DNA_ORIENTATION=-
MPSMPTNREILMFSGPALGLWITGPLLSLIDSSAVGVTGSATQLAALGPATTMIDGASYLFAFINVATTNLMATAVAKEDKKQVDLVVRASLRCAFRCGVGVLALLLALSPQMLGIYVGPRALDTIGPAANYVRIRALSMPTLLISNALQAAMLGAKDSVTPLKALFLAAILNGFGDALLVCWAKWGLSGAAIATVLSQWAGLALLLSKAKTLTSNSNPFTRDNPNETVIQERREMQSKFYAFMPSVVLVVIGKMCAFGFMTNVASEIGTVALAAHQVVLATFFLLAPFSEISSQTFQAFLPKFTAFEDEASQEDKSIARKLTDRLSRKLQVSSFLVATSVAALASLVPLVGAGLFTRDAAVAAALRPLAMPLFLAGALHSLVCSAEGILLVRRELKFLGVLYTASAVVMPIIFMAMKRAGAGLPAVW